MNIVIEIILKNVYYFRTTNANYSTQAGSGLLSSALAAQKMYVRTYVLRTVRMCVRMHVSSNASACRLYLPIGTTRIQRALAPFPTEGVPPCVSIAVMRMGVHLLKLGSPRKGRGYGQSPSYQGVPPMCKHRGDAHGAASYTGALDMAK